jgi:hypothetical protein
VQYKYLHDLNRQDLPPDAMAKLAQLERLDFINSGQNLIFSGNPGTGKTHLAMALGIKACQQGYKVYFTTISRLLIQLRESRSEKYYGKLKTVSRNSHFKGNACISLNPENQIHWKFVKCKSVFKKTEICNPSTITTKKAIHNV